ncbi:MAG: hypothetical protein IPP77_13740 [Bacteroidetes bacterium]|nr:hypothetical protein [Bacteroidota bacterium]
MFPNLPITLSAFKTIHDTYEKKILAADSGDRDKILAMKNYTPIWIDAMDKMGNYVDSVANGNSVTILKSGFHATKNEMNKLQAPEQMVVSARASNYRGRIKIASVNKTNAYAMAAFAFTEDNGRVRIEKIDDHQLNIFINDQFVTAIYLTTKHRGEFQGLPRGKNGHFMMVGFNAAGLGAPSNVIEDVTIP